MLVVRRISFILAVLNVVGLFTSPAQAQVSLTTLGSPYTQSFDTLPASASATWTNNSTIPGWYHARTGTGTTIVADTGTNTAGNLYSYGSTAATDRALGSLGSGNAAAGNFFWGVRLQNNTGATITSLNVSYTGEQWRNSAAAAQTIAFSYLVGSPTVTGSLAEFQSAGVVVPSLDFTSPITGGTAGALSGNLAANRTALTFTITGLSIPNGTEVMLRWSDPDHTGTDHGLSIDDFSVTPNAVPPVNLTINDVSLNEGNAGTTSFTFTVSLSAPAGPGGVTFDIATADGTATQPSDYTQKSLTGQTIPAGSSTYSFTVLVNGDVTPETNETFLVNVTNVTGATVTDGQGQGTIVNDDAAPNLTINDVSLNEGNAGTTTFTFTVSLSAPAGAGGVTFDIATANGTAVAPGDYTTKSLTGQTIPAGSSTYTFDVLVNGDTTPETDETFLVNVTNVTNAIATDGQGQGTIVNDDLARIHDVQGNGAATPIPGATVSVEGVVTADFQGTNIQGFFLQEEDADADADPATSEGIFVFCGGCPTPVAEGQRVRATGTVSEFNLLTEITASTAPSVVVTNAGNNLAQVTPATIDLPIAGVVNDYYEAREGMKVTFVDTLTVSEYFELGRYGQIILYEGGRPRQFTEFNAPSVAGNAAWADTLSRRQVILDDDNNAQEWYLTTSSPPGPADGLQYVYYPRANGGLSVGTQGTDFFRGGDLVNGLTGVLHWSFAGQTGTDAWRIRPTAANPATFTVANPRPATPPAVGGTIHVVGMNLLNYFTTIDTTASTTAGPCSPSGTLDCRGADSVAELNRQRARAALVICTLNADVYGFAELENTTPSASITDLLGAVNASCGGAHPYAFVNTGGTLGTDAIRVQQIYRTGIVSPVGAPLSDLDPIHSRPPTAQTYDVVDATNPAFGQRFTVVINHFKSKGSSAGLPGDTDIGDGAGASNATRTAQANRLLTWINGTVLPAAGDPDVLLLGDFNAYAKEDPINALIAGGYTDLETLFHGANAYSYLFDGQLGHLDYGFASASLLSRVTGADAWHINADEVDLFDYNDEIRDSPGESTFEEKPDGSALVPPRVVFQPGTPYRASDHDPVLVGLFAVADLSVTKTDGVVTAVPGGSVTYTITASNAGPDPVTGGTVADTFPAILTCTWTCVGAGGGTCTASGSGNINDTVNLPVGASVTYTATCAVSSSATGTLSNTATVSGGAVGDSNAANNSATDTDTLTPQANLGITKTDGVTTATAGGSVTYTITASNAGPSNATGATVADTFPASLTCTWTCVGAGGGTCTASGSGNINGTVNLPSGGSVTYTASCVVSAAATGTLSNTATVAVPAGVTDPTPGNNSATDTDTVGAQADLAITKTDGVTTVTPGGSVTYTITASNAGPSNATGATVADTFPASLTCTWTCVGAGGGTCAASGSGNINGTVNLPSGGSVTYTASCAVSAAATGTLSNTATVTAPAGVTDPTPGNNSATDTDTVAASADLSVTKTDAFDPAAGGINFNYTITVTNAGPSPAASVSLSDTLPAGTTFVALSSPGGWSCTTPAVGSGGTVTCSNASLAVGGAVFTLTVAIAPSTTGTISNTATVSSTTTDPNPGNNSDTETTLISSAADISVTKVDTPDPVQAGANLTYTITVGNAGPSNAPTAGLSDTLPAGTTFVSLSSPGGWSCTTPAVGAGGTVTCSNPSMPLGSAVFTLTVAVNSGTANGTMISNTATVTEVGSDLNPGNESATATTTVTVAPSPATVTGTKTAAGTFQPGSTVTYTIVLSNSGTGTQQDNPGAELTDVLPPSLTLVSATATSGAAVATVGTNTVTWNGSIPAGGSVTITIQATINPGTAQGTTISNQGAISYDADGDGTNEAAGVTDSPATGGAGDPTTFVVGPIEGPPPIPTLDEVGLMLLALLLAMGGAMMLRRRRAIR
jgi:uncharacterized repeat protein (TIGR01451 family)